MYTQNPIRLFLTQEFDRTLRVQIGLGTGVGSEREFTDVVLHTRSFQILLRPTDPCHFGVGVDDGWDGGVVDVSVARFDVFHSGDAWLLCQHDTGE